MNDRVQFSVPLPPPSLRANSRAHWSRKKKDADEYSEDVFTDCQALGARSTPVHAAKLRGILPMKAARVRYEWRHAGVAPDHGNLGGHTKYLQDILCMAPKNAKPTYKRWHLGLVEDDKGITAEYEAVKVKTKAEECVVITVEAE